MFFHSVWKPMAAGAVGAALVGVALWVATPKFVFHDIDVPRITLKDVAVDHVVPHDVPVDHVVPHDVPVDRLVPPLCQEEACSVCWSQQRSREPKIRRRRLISAFAGQGPSPSRIDPADQ